MSLIVKEREYELASEGIHDAVISNVEDLGVQDGPFGPQDKALIIVTMSDQKAKDGSTVDVRIYVNKVLGPKANVSKILSQLKINAGKEFSLADLIGLKTKVVVAHKDNKEGKTRANIVLFMPFRSSEKQVADAVSGTDEI